MRIAICGLNRYESILKAESVLNTSAIKPLPAINGLPEIVDYAAETYKYFDEANTIFDGSAFDFLSKENGEGYNEVFEQIAIDSLMNLDYIVVITIGMDKSNLKLYKEYSKLFPNKFYFYTSEVDFEIIAV